MKHHASGFAVVVLVSGIRSAEARRGRPRVAGVSSIELTSHARSRVHIRGRVASVRAFRVGGWWEIMVDGSAPAAERSFIAYAASARDVPLAAGDLVDADLDCTVGGWHYVCDATVRDHAGRLLVAVSGSGNASFAPGFTVAEVPGAAAAPGAPRVGPHAYPLRIGYRAQSVTTRAGGGWVVLTTRDGRFAVSGTASRWEGGPRVPEAVDYTSYAITRLR